MSEVEIEKLVVRLTGNAAEYSAMLSKAVTDTAQAAKTVAESATKMAENFKGGLMDVAKTAGGLLAAFGLGNWLKSSFENFMKAETGLVRLSAAIQANGRDVISSVAGYREFAATLGQVTNTTVGQTLSMARVGESYGLTNNQVRQAISNSVALSGVLGGEAEDHMRIGIALVQGNVQMLRRVPALRGIRDETQLVARAQQLLTSGLAIAQAEMNTTEGQVKRFWNTIAGLKKELGTVLAEALVPLIGYAQKIADWFKSLSAETKRWIGVAIGVVALVAGVGALFTVISLTVGAVWSFVASLVGFMFNLLVVTPLTILWGVATAAVNVVMTLFRVGGVILTTVALVAYKAVMVLATAAMVPFKIAVFVVNTGLALMNMALTAVSGVGILLILAGIALVVVAATSLAAVVGSVVATVAGVGQAIWTALQSVWSAVTATASAVGDAIGRAWEALTAFVGRVWDAVAPMFGRIRDQFAEFFGGSTARNLSNAAGNLGVTIGASMGRGMHRGSESFHAALQGSAEALSRMQAYQDRLGGGGAPATSAATGPLAPVVAAGLSLWEAVRGAATAAWGWIKERAGMAFEDIGDYAADLWIGLLDVIGVRWEDIQESLQSTWREVRTLAVQTFLDLKVVVANIQLGWLEFVRAFIPFNNINVTELIAAQQNVVAAQNAAQAFEVQNAPGPNAGGFGGNWEESRTLTAAETRALMRQMRDYLAQLAEEAGVAPEIVVEAAGL